MKPPAKDPFYRNRFVQVLLGIYVAAPILFHSQRDTWLGHTAIVAYWMSAFLVIGVFCYMTAREMDHPLAKIVRGVLMLYGLALALTLVAFVGFGFAGYGPLAHFLRF